MLWRERYSTRVLEGFRPPAVLLGLESAEVAVGLWQLYNLPDVGVWRRLLAREWPDIVLHVVAFNATPALVEATVPPDQLATTHALNDPWNAWLQAAKPDEDHRVIAWLPAGGLAMIGLPTEEAWSRFSDQIRRIRHGSSI